MGQRGLSKSRDAIAGERNGAAYGTVAACGAPNWDLRYIADRGIHSVDVVPDSNSGYLVTRI